MSDLYALSVEVAALAFLMGGVRVQEGVLKVIGDVHGKYKQYERLVHDHEDTIQVGDMGIGFRRYPHGEPCANPPYDKMRAHGARFIRGNHDNPGVCRGHKCYIPDGHVEDDKMFIGGAHSIDRDYRIEGYSWWPDEQLSGAEFSTIIDVYLAAKPRVMITHDAPLSVVKRIHASHHRFDDTRTQQALQMMFEMHQPDLWVHGHHHVSFDHVVEGTRFVCLAELELREF